jgi:hypothetical protein
MAKSASPLSTTSRSLTHGANPIQVGGDDPVPIETRSRARHRPYLLSRPAALRGLAGFPFEGARHGADLGREPGKCIDQTAGSEPIKNPLPSPLAADKTGTLENSKVPRHGR